MYGADTDIENKDGKTAKDCTKEFEDEDNKVRIAGIIDTIESVKLKFK